MKTLLTTLLIILYLNVSAQTKINALAGFKSFELGTTITDEESELIYGVSVSAVDAGVSEDRANRNDKGKNHEFRNDIVPALFLNIGGKFDNLSIIGKIGSSYVEQKINNEPTKDLFLALGIMASLKVSNSTGLVLSYDSVNSVQFGISIAL